MSLFRVGLSCVLYNSTAYLAVLLFIMDMRELQMTRYTFLWCLWPAAYLLVLFLLARACKSHQRKNSDYVVDSTSSNIFGMISFQCILAIWNRACFILVSGSRVHVHFSLFTTFPEEKFVNCIVVEYQLRNDIWYLCLLILYRPQTTELFARLP